MQSLHQSSHTVRPRASTGCQGHNIPVQVRPCSHISRVIIDPSGISGGVPGYRTVQNLEEAGQQGGPEPNDNDNVERVPISDLPRPHPKAQKTLSKSMNKGGIYKALVDTLGSVSFTVACDDLELGWQVTQGLSRRIGWFPVCTARVLAGMYKVPCAGPAAPGTGGAGGGLPDLPQLIKAAGSEQELAKAELGVLSGLRTQKRVIACSLPKGAIGQPDTWRELWGTFIVWVDEESKTSPKPRTPERQLLGQRSEVLVRLKQTRGFMGSGAGGKRSAEDKAKLALDALLRDLVAYLNSNPDIIERKVKYVAYGCRGDWPEVQPPEWNPLLEGLGRAPPSLPS